MQALLVAAPSRLLEGPAIEQYFEGRVLVLFRRQQGNEVTFHLLLAVFRPGKVLAGEKVPEVDTLATTQHRYLHHEDGRKNVLVFALVGVLDEGDLKGELLNIQNHDLVGLAMREVDVIVDVEILSAELGVDVLHAPLRVRVVLHAAVLYALLPVVDGQLIQE